MATVVAVAAGMTVWIVGRGPESVGPGDPPDSAPTRFDPGQQLIRLGPLPGPARQVSYTTELDMHVLTVAGRPDVPFDRNDRYPPDSNWRVEVMMAARDADVHRYDREYDEEAGWHVPGGSVAPVRGRPARQNEGGILSWEYAPDAWMRISASGVDQPHDLARRVAEGIRWETTPLALPIQTMALPDGAVLGGAALRWADDESVKDYAYAQYLLKPIKDHDGSPEPDFMIGISAQSVADGRDNRTDDVTVSGRPGTAIDWARTDPAVYRVGKFPGGCTECVAEVHIMSRRANEAVGGRDKALKLAASIRLADGHDDPARWRAR
ncbi:hypothetical protein QQG74_18410 [Micromonospora sp. FIMYZ51]|uniref:hypothetical protein n=1 Tax=Micromonospora sp. FIMYZ51 TaxID=3051832 RepID=UPI00311E1B34